MKIVNEYPPNYKEICQAIPGVESKEDVVFTYGDTIYNPYKGEIQDHLDVHETIHKSQQMQIGVEEWWNEYLKDPAFRLKQEISAYRAQYKFVYKRYGWQASKFLPEIARDLSGVMYGNVLTYEQAEMRLPENERPIRKLNVTDNITVCFVVSFDYNSIINRMDLGYTSCFAYMGIKMKILFLDIDGVVNKRENFKAAIKDNLYPIDPYCAFLVGRIQLRTGCEVVLSSSWRHHPEGVENVSERVVKLLGVTPDLYDELNEGKRIVRGDEIKVWLDENPEVKKYDILDDDVDILVEQADNFFKTTFEDGLTDEIAEAVIAHLGESVAK